MHVIYANPRRVAQAIEEEIGAHFVDKATLLAKSDVLSLHVPLNAATRHFLSAAEFAADEIVGVRDQHRARAGDRRSRAGARR